MERKQTTRGRAGSNKTAGIEWLGGIVEMPAYVTGEGEPYRPEVLFWMGPDGAVLGSTAGKPGEVVPMASTSLQRATEEPMCGRAHRPTRVRVASSELAESLRGGHPDIEVVCAPTPELDHMLSAMSERLAETSSPEKSYLAPEITPEAMAAFFQAAAGLFRAKPWELVPDDHCLFSVTIEQFEMYDTAMSVIGQMGQVYGFLLFSDLEGFEAYLDAVADVELGEMPHVPPHFALNFDRGAELAPALRKEIAAHNWELAGAEAYPWLAAVDEELVGRPPTSEEVTIAEVIARALTHVLAEKRALQEAWDGGEPMSRTLAVATHAGEVEVTLCTPYTQTPMVFDPSRDIVAELAALVCDGDELDYHAREALEDELLRRFVASPEGAEVNDVSASSFVMDLAADYHGETIATLGASGLREVLFELIPRKVSITASEAGAMVGELCAFYTFMKREFELEQADACLRVLGGSAVKKLEAALSDSSNFGPAKSMFMAGVDAGFDMHSQDGIDAWMRTVQNQPLPTGYPVPELGRASTPTSKQAKAKKDKRKAARKARKKRR